MSIFSDQKVGALSDVEFHNACVEMNARDRWEREQEYENYDDDLVVDLEDEVVEEKPNMIKEYVKNQREYEYLEGYSFPNV